MRTAAFCIGLFLFGAFEFFEPRAPLQQPRGTRWLANLGFALGNGIAIRLTIGGVFLAWVAWIEQRQYGLMGLFDGWRWGWHGLRIAATIVLLDLSFYVFHHRFMHRWRFGWRFHQVHHTDLDLDVTSASRFHLGELLLSMLYTALVVALFGPPLAGVVIYEGAKLAAAQFNHSNVRLPRRLERFLGFVLVTPAIHWLHHSVVPREANSNYANIFSCWDRLFGTYRGEANLAQLTLGLHEYRDGNALKITDLFLLPWKKGAPTQP